jgi:hypothetical protein
MQVSRRQQKAMARYDRRDVKELREGGMHQDEFEWHMASRTTERAYPGFADGRIVNKGGAIMLPHGAKWELAFWSEDSRDHLVHVIGYHRIALGANGSKSVQTAEFIPFQDMGYDADGVPHGMWRHRDREDGLHLIHLRRLA